MKKIITLFSLLLMVVLYAFQIVNAYQANYLPGGKNYISKDNLLYASVDNSISTKEAFLVKPETDYTISFDQFLFAPGFEVEIIFYQNGTPINMHYISDMDFTIELINGIQTAYASMKTSHDTNYLEIFIYNTNMSSGDPIPDIQLEEGLSASAYEPYIEGSMIDTTSPYFQSSGTIISYVDQPITAQEIQNSLTAHDTIDGDVSANITLVTDAYTEFMTTLGTYSLVFSVSDSSGNVSETTIYVDVVDVLAPVFSDISEITVVYPNTHTVAEIIAMLSASDNYDGDISSQIEMVSDNYSTNASVVGQYSMQFKVADSSGNESFHDLLVHVVDQEAPLIVGDDTLYIGYNNYYSESSMLSALSVSDNYDADVTIVIESNAYKNNHDTLGQYSVIFSATDSSGNISEKTLTVHVVDEIGPMVYLNLQVIQVYSDSVMTLPDFAQLLTKTKELDEEKDYLITVKYDSYSAHANTPGTYHLRLQFEDEYGQITDKEFQINVIDQAIDGVVFGKDNTDISFIYKHQKIFVYGGLSSAFILTNIIWYMVLRKKRIN